MVHFTLPATAFFLLSSSLVLGTTLHGRAAAQEDGDIQTLTDSPNPKAIGQFYYGDASASQICQLWIKTADATLSADPQTAKTLHGCVVADSQDKVMAAYATQVKKQGDIWLHTAAIGHRMDLTPVTTKQDGATCPGKKPTPGYCAIVNPPTTAAPMGALPGLNSGSTDPPQTSGARKMRSVFGLLFQ